MRQVVLDTETTGLEIEQGNRILEIGCVELLDRKLTGQQLHQYINPQRASEEGALEVHGITTEFLADKPVFADVFSAFLEFVKGAELVIHNAPFDIAFINAEMRRMSPKLGVITDYCTVVDSLVLARQKHPGQKNNLNALCKRYTVDTSQRELHGALLDAEILADVYLLMTGGQVMLSLGESESESGAPGGEWHRLPADRKKLKVVNASAEELQRHDEKLQLIDKVSEGNCVWRKLQEVN
jgi:DNA polymerase-3 subunit epsilon